MEEIVQAINNLSKPNITDYLNVLFLVISIGVTGVFSYILYKQNKDSNERNEDLQKKLNEIENKRILHNTILNIYNNCLMVKNILLEFENQDKRLNIIMNFNIKNNFFTRVNDIKFNNIYYLSNIDIIFSKDEKISNCLKNIIKKYDEFYEKIYIYFLNYYKTDYDLALSEAKKVIEIKEYQYNNNILNNIYNNNFIHENEIINNIQIREIFKNKLKNSSLDDIVKLSSEILECFNDEFYNCFEKYLSIKKMDI